ncbi:hypothetical protein AMTRI_Chr06g179430 [Amborella trichopoda]
MLVFLTFPSLLLELFFNGPSDLYGLVCSFYLILHNIHCDFATFNMICRKERSALFIWTRKETCGWTTLKSQSQSLGNMKIHLVHLLDYF